MALASEHPIKALIKLVLNPAPHHALLLPVLGVASGISLAIAHLSFWSLDYWSLMSPLALPLVLFAFLSLGLVASGLLVLWLSEGTPQLGLVPVAAVGLVLFDFCFEQPGFPVTAERFMDYLQSGWGQTPIWLGFWVGLFCWPQLGLLVQRTTAVTQRMSTLLFACAAIGAVWAGDAVGSGLYRYADVVNPFIVLGLAGLLMSVIVLWRLPIAFLQFFAWVFIHAFYRVRARGLHHIPARGPVLLVCNHVSFVDSFLIGGTIKRPPRFVMDKGFYEAPIVNFVFRTAKTIPIAPAKKDPELLEKAYDRIAEELNDGQVVLVFPEGAITWDGEMIAFKEGVERIVKRTPVRVVPLALRGLWGSWFSRSNGGTFKGLPKLWRKIEVRAGEIIEPEDVSAADLQQKVQQLRGQWR